MKCKFILAIASMLLSASILLSIQHTRATAMKKVQHQNKTGYIPATWPGGMSLLITNY